MAKVLFQTRTSVTGAMLTVSEEDGIRTLFLDDLCQSDVHVRDDGLLDCAQPLELVQVMSLFASSWCTGDAPRVLLLGLGGGSIARVLRSALPRLGRLHSVELEPEVITAATQFFGLELDETHCTVEAAECSNFLKQEHTKLRKKCASRQNGNDVILLDAFTSQGLAPSVREQATLDHARGCLSPTGLLLVNLHTGPPSDPDDPDYYIARAVLRSLCARFESVYSILCNTTQNLIAVCHDGSFLDSDEWQSRLAAQLQIPEIRAALVSFDLGCMMNRFEFVGGIEQPMSEDDGEDVPPGFRAITASLSGGRV